MTRREGRTVRRLGAVVAAAALAATAIAGFATPATAASDNGFVGARGGNLVLNGKTYEFAGTNNYYLGYKSSTMVDAVLDDAATAGFDVIRTWGFQDYQNPDGSGSVHQNFEGVWYQAWDAEAGAPTVNEGANGLQKLDYVIAAAKARGIKLVIPFTNNWNAFGGMDQYVRWAGLDEHADFYTDATIRGWFKDWISTLLTRVNPLTGVAYKDDPTIMAWELANEPRCTSAGVYPDGACDTTTITTWADEMSTYVKSIDGKHLLSAGDEGFFCRDESQWTLAAEYGASGYGEGFGEDCGDGVDTIALASLPNIDMMSMHLYPDHWKTSTAWGTGWILEHAAAAAAIGKPVYLGEFGLNDKATRMPVYFEWLQAVRDSGVDGALYWILSSEEDNGALYADYDGFTVYCPSQVCTLITTHDALISSKGNPGKLKQTVIADDDALTLERDTVAQIDLLANDVAFSQPIKKLDLDPATAGIQTSATVAGGSIAVVSGGTVVFTPTPGYTGKAAFRYTVSNNMTSSTATLTATVRPALGDPVVIASWESGTEGWAGANWQSDPGSLATGATGATDGVSALQVTSNGAWFGSPADSPVLDLSARTSIDFDITTTPAAGTSVSVAVRSGDAWSWCQSTWHWVPEDTSETVSFPLDGFGCDASTLTEVHDVLVFFNAGQFSIDRLTVK